MTPYTILLNGQKKYLVILPLFKEAKICLCFPKPSLEEQKSILSLGDMKFNPVFERITSRLIDSGRIRIIVITVSLLELLPAIIQAAEKQDKETDRIDGIYHMIKYYIFRSVKTRGNSNLQDCGAT